MQNAPGGNAGCFGLPNRDAADTVQYAARKGWYLGEEPLLVFGERYVKFGLPRTADDVPAPPVTFQRVGEYDGVPIYVEKTQKGQMPKPLLLYVPLNQECHFQVYAQGHMLRE